MASVGESIELAEFGGRPMALPDFLKLALQSTNELVRVHAQGLIHRAVTPSNILIDPGTAELALTNVGGSTLPYVSPEQTGRTGRDVDSRSDLYSLGVVFYELLIGHPPFVSGSPLELIHAHLARRPEPPKRLRPELPTPLSELVMKLLEKAPERRYQSARGLVHDLEVIADAVIRGAPLEALELGRRDLPSTIALPHDLFGREAELEQVRAAFRAAATGQPRLLVLQGPAGIGKSTLLGELVETVLGQRGVLIRGKFDPGAQQPFAGILAALDGLADQLLVNDDATLQNWRGELERELGSLADIVRELVPKFVAVLGAAANRSEVRLGAVEQRARTRLALSRVLLRMARVEHPLVLVLDDLHWADSASLELLGNLLAEPNIALLLAATTRETTLLAELFARARDYGIATVLIDLGPLSNDALTGLIAAMLGHDGEQLTDFVALVARKTGSNPLFVRQFLLFLVEHGLLRQRVDVHGISRWSWELAELEAASLPADSLAMMTAKLAKLPEQLGELAVVASVIGSRFEAELVEAIVGRSIAGDLRRLADEGLIASQGEKWKFSHDRIREAAYASLTPERARALHLQVAAQLARRDSQIDVEHDEQLTEHLDRGHGLLPLLGRTDELERTEIARALAELDRDELARLVELNLRAGVRAAGTGAPSTTVRLLELAAAALAHSGDAELERRHGFELELVLGEALGLVGKYSEAHRHFDALLAREWKDEQYAALVIKRHWLLALQGELPAAYEFGCQALTRLGMAMPRRSSSFAMARSLFWLISRMRMSVLGRVCEPHDEDPRVASAIAVATVMLPSSYMVGPQAYLVLLIRLVEHTLRHGDHGIGGMLAAQLALLFAIGFEQQALADQLLTLESRSPRAAANEHRRMLSAAMVRQWRIPCREVLTELREACELSLEVGDLETADYCQIILLSTALHGGLHLQVVGQQAEMTRRRRGQWGTRNLGGSPIAYVEFCKQLLVGPLPEAGSGIPLADDYESEIGRLETRVLGAALLVFAGHWHEAVPLLDEVIPQLEQSLRGTQTIALALALQGVAAGALLQAGTGDRVDLLRRLRRNHARLERWTKRGGNLGIQAELLLGELRACEGSFAAAMASYEGVAARALAANLPMWEGLACERMAELAARHQCSTLLGGPLARARDSYRRWGAAAKVAVIEQRWARELATQPSSTADPAIDVVALLQTSQTIAADLRLEDVIARVLHIAMQTAGAERGALVLAGDEGLLLAAECRADAEGLASAINLPLSEAGARVPISLLRWVERTRESLVLADLGEDLRFAGDPYVRQSGTRSILCQPIIEHGRLAGLLYLENNLSAGTFTSDRLEILRLLIRQAANALVNAQLYEALRTSEVRWRSLVERMPDTVVVVSRHGQVEFVNHLDDDVIGSARIGGPLLDVIAPEHAARAGECLADALAGRSSALELEFLGVRTRPRWWAVKFAPITVDGHIERVIVVATETTARRELEQHVRQQQRLESIGTLASGVAHEINNPVQGIKNYAELIHRSPYADAEICEFAQEIEYETTRVSTIVRKLLAFSRQDSSTPEWTTVAEVIEGTVSLIRMLLRREQITLHINLQNELPKLECAPQQIQQVLMNLVTNARDALVSRFPGNDADKRVEIAAQAFARDQAPWIRISVSDCGGGISPELVARIFDPFFTTKDRDRGTGLGLAVSHGIIKEHGGELRLDNRPGHGATFHVELPCNRRTQSS